MIAIKHELTMLARIEKDLAKARGDGRFNDVIVHLEELVPFQMFSDDQATRDRCAAILRGTPVAVA